jgi:hypothetical protein
MSLEDAFDGTSKLSEGIDYCLSIKFYLFFFLIAVLPGRSIKPINSIIETNIITKDNLTSGFRYLKIRDELYFIKTINNLLTESKTPLKENSPLMLHMN